MSDYRLTPQMVRDKQFHTTRLRPGYDEVEVDEFLDLVESEVSLLIRERGDARAELDKLRRVLPKDLALDASSARVGELYRVMWGAPHPDAGETS
ncbi:MAG: DivIVA domain-containing protein [Actinomadura sp.]